MFTKENLDQFIRGQWADRNQINLADGERVGASVSELIDLSVQRNAEAETPYLDLWMGIFDELVSWLISLLTVLYSERRDRCTFTNFDRSIALILMRVIADSLAMRHLILLGYHAAAKILLRSVAEHLQLLVVTLDDPQLADEFVQTDAVEKAQSFGKTIYREDQSKKGLGQLGSDFLATMAVITRVGLLIGEAHTAPGLVFIERNAPKLWRGGYCGRLVQDKVFGGRRLARRLGR